MLQDRTAVIVCLCHGCCMCWQGRCKGSSHLDSATFKAKAASALLYLFSCTGSHSMKRLAWSRARARLRSSCCGAGRTAAQDEPSTSESDALAETCGCEPVPCGSIRSAPLGDPREHLRVPAVLCERLNSKERRGPY